MAVNLDDGGVDHGVLHIGIIRASLEKPNENIGFDPVSVALEDGVPVAEKGRQITPGTARANHPQNRLDKEPIVSAAATRVRWLAQAVRFHSRPLGVCQYKTFHP